MTAKKTVVKKPSKAVKPAGPQYVVYAEDEDCPIEIVSSLNEAREIAKDTVECWDCTVQVAELHPIGRYVRPNSAAVWHPEPTKD